MTGSRLLGLLIVPLMVLNSCRDSSGDNWPSEESFTFESGQQVIPLHAGIVECSRDYLYASKFFVYADSVMVVVNSPRENRPIVELADLRSGTLLAQTLMYGNGPFEALQAKPHMRGRFLFVEDFARQRLLRVDIHAMLVAPSDYLPEVIGEYNGLYPTFATQLDDHTMLLENPYCFDDKTTGISNGPEDRFFFLKPGREKQLYQNERRYDTYNVSQGILVPFVESDRIFFLSLNLPQIEVYNGSGGKIKKLYGPTDLPVEYSQRDGSVYFRGQIPYGYLSATSFGGRLYANYIGGYFKKDEDYTKLHGSILELDMNGNLIRTFVSPVYISSFSVTSSGDIYGQGFDESYTHVLWKLSTQDE